MKFLILVSWLAASACLVVVRADDVFVDGVRHLTEVLIDNVNLSWPSPLAVDYVSNNLYFIEARRPAILKLSLNASEHEYIEGVFGARSLTVDQESRDLYLGTTGGIYKYSPSTGASQLVGAEDDYVWQGYFKGVLYYTDFWLNTVYTLNNGHSDKLVNMQYEVYGFVIDDEDVMFFRNSTGMYSQQLASDQAILYYDDAIVHNMALDRHGKVYFTSNDGIYEVIKYNATVRKIISIKEPLGIVFDNNNNMIYSVDNTIVRLKPIVETNNHNNIVDVEKLLEGKLDVIDKKIDKLFTDLVKILESRDKKNYYLSQIKEKLLTDKVERRLESMEKKVYELLQKVDLLVVDQVERTMESMDKTVTRVL